MVLLTLLYAFLLMERGLVLLASGELLQIVFGLAILVFPVFAVWSIIAELRFGSDSAKLAKALALSELKLPEYELKPSGRATEESGARAFAQIEQMLQQDQNNHLLWIALADSYDKLGDRRRARSSARRAIALAKQSGAL